MKNKSPQYESSTADDFSVKSKSQDT